MRKDKGKSSAKRKLLDHPAGEEFTAHIKVWLLAQKYFTSPEAVQDDRGKGTGSLQTLRYLSLLKIRLENRLTPALHLYASKLEEYMSAKPSEKILDALLRDCRHDVLPFDDVASYFNYRKHYVFQDLVDAAERANHPFTIPEEEDLRVSAAEIETYAEALWILNDAEILCFLVTTAKRIHRSLNEIVHINFMKLMAEENRQSTIDFLMLALHPDTANLPGYTKDGQKACNQLIEFWSRDNAAIPWEADFCDQLQRRADATLTSQPVVQPIAQVAAETNSSVDARSQAFFARNRGMLLHFLSSRSLTSI